MPMVQVDVGILQELLVRRDELIRAITTGMASGEWDQVMAPFDELLVAIKRLEGSLGDVERKAS